MVGLRCSSYGVKALRRILAISCNTAAVGSEAMISQRADHIRRIAAVLIAMAAMVASGGCSWQEPAAGEQQPRGAGSGWPDNSVGARAAAIALEQIGVPYRYGGDSPRGFDCSGLVQYSYRGAGKIVSRTTGQLWRESESIDGNDLRVGDLVFFRIQGKVSHVGLYIGDDRFVHAPSTGRPVSVETLGSDYYRRAFVRAGRPR